MRERLQIPVPMWRVQFQLQGGHRRVWWIVTIVVLLEIVAAFAFRRAMQRETLDQVCKMMLYALAVFQVGLMFLAGPNAIYRAMLRDYESKMIESHRMTPISNIGVTLGYLFGPPLLVTLIFFATMLFGAFVARLADADLARWFGAHALIFISATSVWALTVFWGMRQGKPFSPAPIVVGVSAFSVPLAMHPAAGAVLGLYAIAMAFAACVDKGKIGLEAFIGLGFVSLLTACFWLGLAATKYRRPDLPVLNSWRGLLMLLLWMLLSTIGMFAWDSVGAGQFGGGSGTNLRLTQWIATMISGVAIGCVVAIATASSSILIRQGRMPRSAFDRVHEIPVAVSAALLICGIMYAGLLLTPQLTSPSALLDGSLTDRLGPIRGPWAASLMVCLSALLSAGALCRLTAARLKVKSPYILTFVVLLALWALPVIGDVIRAQIVSRSDTLVFSSLLGCSPGGAIAAIWLSVDIPIHVGVASQGLLALLLVALSRPFARTEGRGS